MLGLIFQKGLNLTFKIKKRIIIYNNFIQGHSIQNSPLPQSKIEKEACLSIKFCWFGLFGPLRYIRSLD